MAVKRLTLEDVATLLGMAGAAGFMGGGSAGGVQGDFLTEVFQSVGVGPDASLKDSASKYPESQMMVEIQPVNDGIHNAKLQVGVAEEAAKMQTLKEHNDALNKFLKPGQTPAERAEALRKGKQAEKELLSFWADKTPRVSYTPSSSAVKAVRITPDNRVQVMWQGKHSKNNPDGWYTFLPSSNPYKASEAFQALVTAPSIGRAVYPVVSRPLKKFNPYINNNWNKKHYDPSMATPKAK